jgi:uncharacterized membrane protein
MSPPTAGSKAWRSSRTARRSRPALWGTSVPVDAGKITLVFTAPNHDPLSIELTIDNGTRTTERAPALKPSGPAPQPSPSAPAATAQPTATPATASAATSAPTAQPTDGASSSTLRLAGFVGVGVGAVALAGGTYLMLGAISNANEAIKAIDEAKKINDRKAIDSNLKYFNDNKTPYYGGLVALGVGGALALGGVYLIVTNPKKAETSSLRVTPAAGRDQAGLWLSGRW